MYIFYRSTFQYTREDTELRYGTKKQVSSSSICEYNFLRKAGTSFESLYCPGKVRRPLRVQELRYRKRLLYRRKANVYHKLERKGPSTMASARSIRAKFEDRILENQTIQENLKFWRIYNLVSSLLSRNKTLAIAAKNTQKQILNFPCSVQF